MKNWTKLCKIYLVKAVSGLIWLYQKTISPDHGCLRIFSATQRCRFFPSCSDYALASIRQYGLLKGAVASLKRIIRCNPFHPVGYDPVK